MTERFIVQVYEIQTPREADAMIGLGVDHVGSVAAASPMGDDHDLPATVAAARRGGAVSSLIPLLDDTDAVCRLLDDCRPDIVHFCENPMAPTGEMDRVDALVERQKTVRRRFPRVRIMRSVPIAVDGSLRSVPTLDLADRFGPWSDLFLTDTVLTSDSRAGDAAQPVEGFVGITGRTSSWDTAALLVERSPIPVILAGGIGPDNVAAAVRHVRPAGVDSCTGTNAVDGSGRPIRFRKDPDRVRRFVQAARRAAEDRK